jgi:predicted enzyme related to lactoylglutathione lyase
MLIRVRDLDRSMRFYSGVLGIEFEKHSPQTCMGRLDRLSIVLEENKQPGMTTAVSFAVDDLAASRSLFEEHGGKVFRELAQGPSGTSLILSDPDGTALEFVEFSAEARQAIGL